MKLRYPKSFLTSLLVGFLIVALPLILGLLWNAWSIDRLSEQSEQAVHNASRAMQASRALSGNITTMERAARQYAIFGQAPLLEGYGRARAQFVQTAEQFRARQLDPDQRAALEDIIRIEAGLHAVVNQATPSADIAQQLGDEFLGLSQKATALNLKLEARIDREVAALKDFAAESRNQVVWLVLAMVPSALMLIAGFTWILVTPIRALDRAIRGLGEGALGTPIAVEGPADIAHLGEQLDWLRQRLIALEDQKTRFMQHVSHELKTPLTALCEGSNLLNDGVLGRLTPEQQEVAQILQQNSLTLERLIQDLLHHSATQGSRATLDVRPVVLSAVMEQVVASQKIALVAKHIQLNLKHDHAVVQGDAEKIRVIIDNLLSNAIKYSPDGSEIWLRLTRLVDQAVIEVVDQGPGIPTEDAARIFEAFFRGKGAATAKGTGLGLAIVSDYVALHGGTVRLVDSAESEFVGWGAHFEVTLPCPTEGPTTPRSTA